MAEETEVLTPEQQAAKDAEAKEAQILAEIEAKRVKLEKEEQAKPGAKIDGKVKALYYRDETDQPVIGFLREPNRMAKVRIADEIYKKGIFQAGELALQVCLIIEQSDPRIMSNDTFFIAAGKEATDYIEIGINQLNKKK